ncbi:MAG: hypothetical protein FWC23_06495 [Chitinispirillia bacterium]|nr:hypothetical protein [Chitinispirillia bacterium]MCL2268816.1 hypothetical protein [Chitinispirillia bacterium]
MRITLVLITTLIMAGCVGKAAAPSWHRVKSGYHYTGKLGFTAELPANWMVYEDISAQTLVLTRHSVPMDVIQIKRNPVSKPLPNTELTLNGQMRTYELAEIVVNSHRAAFGVFDLKVEALAPDEIDGRETFRLLMSFAIENGMRRRCLVYGFLSGDGRYYNEIGLYALEEHYFDAVIDDFLALVGSFKVSYR